MRPNFLPVCLFLLLFIASVRSLTVTWTPVNASTVWEDAANWQPPQVPGSSDDVYVSIYGLQFVGKARVRSLNIQVGGSLTLMPGAFLYAGSIVSSGAITLAAAATLWSASSIVLAPQSEVFLQSGLLTAQTVINVTQARIWSGSSGSMTATALYFSDGADIWVRPDDTTACLVSNASLTVRGLMDFGATYNFLRLYATSDQPLISGVLHGSALIVRSGGSLFIDIAIVGNDNSWLLLDVPSITEEKVGAIDALSLSIAPSAPKQCANSNDRTLQTTTAGPTTKSRGTCVINGLIVLVGGDTVCPAQPACAQNYGGGDCTTPLCTSSCSGRGTCIGVSPATPYCQCATGWQGSTCEIASCPAQCTGDHGICLPLIPTPACLCASGWTGDDCSVPVCTGCTATQYCEGLVNPPECRCNAGWSGPLCDIPVNETCPRECSGGGVCNDTSGVCTCDADQGGLDCSVPLCTDNCNFRGVCEANHTCTCSAGYFGPTCRQANCSNGCVHGDCDTFALVPQCVCLPDWDGVDCTLYKGDNTAPPASLSRGLTKSQKIGIAVGVVAFGVAAIVVIGVVLAKQGVLRSLFTAKEDVSGLVR